MSNLVRLGLVFLVLGIVATALPAAEQAEQGKPAPTGGDEKKTVSVGYAIAIVGACFGAALCAMGGGYAISRIGGTCIEAMARQPEAATTMFTPMVVSAAMVEGGMLFAIVVCLIAVFAL